MEGDRLRPRYLPNSRGCIPTSESSDVFHIVDFEPRPLNWLSDGQFLDRFVFDEANLSNFVGAMSWLKNCSDWASKPVSLHYWQEDEEMSGSAMVERISAGWTRR